MVLPLRAVAEGGGQDYATAFQKERSFGRDDKGSVVLPLRAVAEGGGQGYATAFQKERSFGDIHDR